MGNIIEVMRLTTKDGLVYHNRDYSPDLIAATLKRCPDWKTIELIKMTEQDYIRIPATQESAQLWRTE